MSKPPQPNATTAQVDRLVEGLDLAAANEQVAEVAARVAGLGSVAVAALARGLFARGEGRREKVAVLLACLTGEAASWAAAELEQIVNARPLNPTERAWVVAILRRLSEEADGPGESQRATPQDLLDDETELLLWRDELASLAPDDQENAIAPLLQDGNPDFLPLVEMAMSLASPRLDAAVASSLARFATPATLPLLRELLRRPDAAVRKLARAALVALERQGVATRDLFVAQAPRDEPVAACLATRPDGAGHIALLVARGRTPGRLRYAMAIVDPIESGIARVWGETGLTEAELRERVADYARQSRQEFLPLDLATAQAIVAAAEDYARKQGKHLPPDYVAWRRCIGSPPCDAEMPVVFGPSCSRCGTRIRNLQIVRGGCIAGRVALCANCAAKSRACAACGRHLDHYLDDYSFRTSADGSLIEFLCTACSHKAGKSR